MYEEFIYKEIKAQIKSSASQESYGQPTYFCKINTFLYDKCNPADCQPGSPSNHHTMHTTVSLLFTHDAHHMKSIYNVIKKYFLST